MDGVSFSNAGFKMVNPTEVNIQTEALAKTEAETAIKKLDKSHETKTDSENTEDSEGDLQGRDSDEEEDESDNNSENTEELIKQNKKFRVKFNSSTEMIEMLDAVTGKIIETIRPDDLINLLSKSKNFSGVFVDRKV